MGLKFNNTNIQLDAAGTNALVHVLISANAPTVRQRLSFRFSKVAGSWKFLGNGRKAHLRTYAIAWKQDFISLANGTATSSNSSGVRIEVDPFDWNSNGANTPIASAIVTGPGLGNGITLVNGKNRWLKVANLTYESDIVSDCGATGNTAPCVNVAAAVDNSTYTVVLRDAVGNSLNGAGDTIILPKAPVATSAVDTTTLPNITSVTFNGVPVDGSNIGSIAPGGTLGLTWTMPGASYNESLVAWVDTAGGQYFRLEKNPPPAATSVSLAIGASDLITAGTPVAANAWVEGRDSYGRAVAHGKTLR